jgi:hypothetical protein
MLVRPNRTLLQARVLAIRPERDGWGAEVDLEVVRNESESPEEDFLRPAAGSTVTAFAAEPARLQVGSRVRVQASLIAGPAGGRVVLESVEPAPPTP